MVFTMRLLANMRLGKNSGLQIGESAAEINSLMRNEPQLPLPRADFRTYCRLSGNYHPV